jgi:hypothetical protein
LPAESNPAAVRKQGDNTLKSTTFFTVGAL